VTGLPLVEAVGLAKRYPVQQPDRQVF